MEVVGTTIAILQLIGKITTYTRTASGSQDDRLRLRGQLQACENVIHLLQDHCSSNASHAWIQSMKRLEEPGQPLECLLRALKVLEDIAEKLSNGGSLKAALKWPFKKDEVETLMRVVDQNISLLLVALNNESGGLLRSLDDQFGEYKKRIEKLRKQVQTLGQDGQNQFQTLKDDLSKIRTSQVDIQSGVSRLYNHKEQLEAAKKRKEILDWISEFDPWKQQLYIFSTRLDNTGLWFLRSAEYQNWKKVTGQTLLCPGMPGAGKRFSLRSS
jgi:chromosome segregation ATPase